MKPLLSAGAVLAGLALSNPVLASCTQAQLAGTWTAQSVSLDTNGYLAWTTCTLSINTVGGFSANTSACLNSLGQKSNAQGSLKVFNAANCAYDGALNLVNFLTTVYVRNFTLSMDHLTGSGIGGGGAYGGVFVFNMVKVK